MAKKVRLDEHGLCVRSRRYVYRPLVSSLIEEGSEVRPRPLGGCDFAAVVSTNGKFEIWLNHGKYEGSTSKSWIPGERKVTYNGQSITVGPSIGADAPIAGAGRDKRPVGQTDQRRHPTESNVGRKGPKSVPGRKSTIAA